MEARALATTGPTGLQGVREVGTEGPTALELTGGAGDRAVPRAALATGPVREFTRRRPALAIPFRDVVSEGGEA